MRRKNQGERTTSRNSPSGIDGSTTTGIPINGWRGNNAARTSSSTHREGLTPAASAAARSFDASSGMSEPGMRWRRSATRVPSGLGLRLTGHTASARARPQERPRTPRRTRWTAAPRARTRRRTRERAASDLQTSADRAAPKHPRMRWRGASGKARRRVRRASVPQVLPGEDGGVGERW